VTGVYITDYIDNPDIESDLLDGILTDDPQKVEVLLVWHQKINAQYLDQFPNLRGVVRYGVGFDTVNLNDIKSRGLVFCNTPDYGTDEVSDTALAMLMNIIRGVSIYDFECRNYSGSWQENTIKRLHRTTSLSLGVIGAGRIGTALIRKACATGINISFYDPYLPSGYEKSIGVSRYYDLYDMLSQVDIISIHTPLTEETRGMVNKKFIALMKKRSSFINTARGEIIDNLDDFYDAMVSGHITSIGLDVLPHEPPRNCKLIKSWKDRGVLSSRITINPHVSYYSIESYRDMRYKAAKNAKRIINGEEPLNIIVDGRSV